MITGARNLITIADPPMARGGFLEGALVIDVENGDHSLLGIEYDSMACSARSDKLLDDFCNTDIGEPDCDNGVWVGGGTKYFEPVEFQVEGDPFAIFTGVSCMNQTMEMTRKQARRSFDYAERRSVDKAVMALLQATPPNVISGPAIDAAQALGMVEAAVMNVYGGVPLIAIAPHMVAPFCRMQIISPNLDGTFSTCLGSTVVAAFNPLGENTIYGMGRMVIVRGPVIEVDAPNQMIPCFSDGVPGVPAVPGTPFAGTQTGMLWSAAASGPPGDGHVGSGGGGAVSGVHRWSNLAPGGGNWPAMLLALDPSYTQRKAHYIDPADTTKWTEFAIGTPVNAGAYYNIPMTATGVTGAGGPFVPAGENSPITVSMTAISPETPAVPPVPPVITGNIESPPRALVERIYVMAVECQVYSANVNLCPCVSGSVITTPGGTGVPPTEDPPELLYLSQSSVSVGAPDFTLHVHGEHLDDDTDVVVNGVHYPTAFIDDHELEIVVHPSDNVPGTYTISLQNPNGTSATTLNFTFTP